MNMTKNLISRQGTKRSLARDIISYFPPHKVYIEPFFGAGGLFFAKPLAEYNYLNDIDDDVFNFWRIFVEKPKKLMGALEKLIVTETQLKRWGAGEQEKTDLMRAVRFFVLSNYSFMSSGHTLANDRLPPAVYVAKKTRYFDDFHKKLSGALFYNRDYVDFLECVVPDNLKNAFCYCDPPYVNTDANYAGFTANDFCNLLDVLISKNIKFAVSEFDSDFVVREAKKRKLNVVRIKERKNLKNRRMEILIMNYDAGNSLFFNG